MGWDGMGWGWLPARGNLEEEAWKGARLDGRDAIAGRDWAEVPRAQYLQAENPCTIQRPSPPWSTCRQRSLLGLTASDNE